MKITCSCGASLEIDDLYSRLGEKFLDNHSGCPTEKVEPVGDAMTDYEARGQRVTNPVDISTLKRYCLPRPSSISSMVRHVAGDYVKFSDVKNLLKESK